MLLHADDPISKALRWGALAVVAVAVAVTPGLSTSRTGRALVGGGGVVGATVAPGEVRSFSTFVAMAAGDDRVVKLRSVEAEDVEGLTVVGTTVNGPGRRSGGVGGAEGFPPPDFGGLVPLRGAVVPPGRAGLVLTFGVRRDAPGRGSFSGFDVTYSVNGVLYRQSFPMDVSICAGTPTVPCANF